MICDISKYQGAIDWGQLFPRLDFAILRASIGTSADERYKENVSGCERYRVPYHAFHYIKAATEAAARTEAKAMSEAVKGTSPLFYVIDAEYSGIPASKARAICEAFEDGLRHYIGPDIRVAVYIGHHLYKSWALDYSRYAYVWIPRYGKNDGTIDGSKKPDYPCDLWQYTSTGRLSGIAGNVDLDALTGTKPMEYFTAEGTGNREQGTGIAGETKANGGETKVATNYDKYILSTGTHYISNSGKDENNQYRGGVAGDQTGHEWELKAWYNRPWTVVLRYPDQAVALKIAELGVAAALNNKIGYDQGQRTTYWTQLQKAGYDPSKITTACEEDCTAGVTANCKAVGYMLNIPGLKALAIDTYSGNMKSRFVAAGFKALTASKYLSSGNYLLPGDILLYEGHHAATNITVGKSVRSEWHPGSAETAEAPAEKLPEGLSKGDHGTAVTAMQEALLKWNPKCLPKYGADGDFGSETENAVKAFQAAAGLTVTGVYDEATRKALTGIEKARQQVKITGDTVNVRTGPSTSYKIVGIAKKGETYEYTKVSDGWYQITFKGSIGWVSGKYSAIVGDGA